jgi:hypothetical protein
MRDRGYRHEQLKRVKRKIRKIWWVGKSGERLVTPRYIGHMASTHGKPCSCHMCGNPRKFAKGGAKHGTWAGGKLTVQEQREGQESLEVLLAEESMAAIRHEIDETECDDPDCDCQLKRDLKEVEAAVLKVVLK